MYKYNKNDNMTKELVWSSGQCFPWSGERLGFESWLLQFACNIIWGQRRTCGCTSHIKHMLKCVKCDFSRSTISGAILGC